MWACINCTTCDKAFWLIAQRECSFKSEIWWHFHFFQEKRKRTNNNETITVSATFSHVSIPFLLMMHWWFYPSSSSTYHQLLNSFPQRRWDQPIEFSFLPQSIQRQSASSCRDNLVCRQLKCSSRTLWQETWQRAERGTDWWEYTMESCREWWVRTHLMIETRLWPN